MAGKGGIMKDDGTRPGLLGQLAGFGVVGVIAFVIDYGLMILLTEVFGVNYLLSTTISFVMSVIFNYLASMRFVFAAQEGHEPHARVRDLHRALGGGPGAQ